MSKRLSKYIASFDYFDKSLIVLSVTTGSISIASFATVIGAPVGMMSASCSLAFSITTGFVKKFLKTIRNKKKKHNKIVMLARSKLNSIESKISEALINNDISFEDFMTIINGEKKYQELKESISMMKSQRRDVEKINLIGKGKKIGINEVIKRNEIINKFKTVNIKWNLIVWGVKNIQKNINHRVANTSNGKKWYYQNVQNVAVKNQDLLKVKKQKDY